MRPRRLKAELWEIQVILYWILGTMLLHDGHTIGGWIAVGYGVLTLVSCYALLIKDRVMEKLEEPTSNN